MSYNDRSSPPILDETEAAQFLRVSIRTLQSWRVSGSGPCFIKMGRSVRYNRAELARWLEGQTYASTSAYAIAG